MRTAEQTKRKKIRLIVKECTVSRIFYILWEMSPFIRVRAAAQANLAMSCARGKSISP